MPTALDKVHFFFYYLKKYAVNPLAKRSEKELREAWRLKIIKGKAMTSRQRPGKDSSMGGEVAAASSDPRSLGACCSGLNYGHPSPNVVTRQVKMRHLFR